MIIIISAIFISIVIFIGVIFLFRNKQKFNLFSGEGFRIFSKGNLQVPTIELNSSESPSAVKDSKTKLKKNISQVNGESKVKKERSSEGLKNFTSPGTNTGLSPDVKPSNVGSNNERYNFQAESPKTISLEEISNPRINEVIKLLFNQGLMNPNIKKSFNSQKEAEDFLIQETISIFENKYLQIKEKLTDLRKAGKDVKVMTLDVMRVPLKIKMLKSDFSKKNVEVLTLLINDLLGDFSEFKN